MHQPVMTKRIIDVFSKAPGPMHFLDATFGRGGHSKALLNTFPECKVSAIDCDPEAVSYAQESMAPYKERFSIKHCRFSQVKSLFQGVSFSGILMDVGISSPQIDQKERGFSIQQDGPLDMRMDNSTGQSAADIIRSTKEKDLADLIFHYGEETNSRRIAKSIVNARSKKPITTTAELSQIVARASGYRRRIHPATKTFQALRIAVNQELKEMQQLLLDAESLVDYHGILCTICFHSLEDRIAKRFFRESKDFLCTEKKPFYPDREEVVMNPRSRSARLRFGIRSL